MNFKRGDKLRYIGKDDMFFNEKKIYIFDKILNSTDIVFFINSNFVGILENFILAEKPKRLKLKDFLKGEKECLKLNI